MKDMQESYGLLVGGKFSDPATACYRDVCNPANGEVIASVADAGEEDLDQAVRIAHEAFAGWSRAARGERARVLNAIADAMQTERERLARIETLNTGKCLVEADIQIGFCIDQYRYFAAAIAAHEDVCVQHDNGSYSLIQREPLGVVGIILPYNAPSMLMSWKLAPALAAGNTVVIKPASNAPLPVIAIAELMQQFLPAGVVNVVTAPGKAGNALVTHPLIAKISFTGSTAVGTGIGALAARNVVPCTLELGGKSAFTIFEDANIPRALQFATLGILSSAGQVCVAGSRLLVQDTIYARVVENLKEIFERVRVGDPLDQQSQMGPVIDEGQAESILSYVEQGVAEGARLVCGGARLSGGVFDKGAYMAPTILADVAPSATCAQEEIFGPVIVVIPFRDEAEAIAIANESRYGLGGAVFTENTHRAHRVAKAIRAGTVWVNEYLNSTHGAPFGGVAKSGIGREVHKMALEHYSTVKNICIGTSEDVPPIF